jgi:hypothetical protein
MADNSQNKKGIEPQNYLQPKLQDDGFMFPLRDDAYLLIKMQTPTTAMVMMWQGANITAPDTGNIFTQSFRSRLAQAAEGAIGDEAPFITEDMEKVAAILGTPRGGGKTLMDELKDASERSVMERLVLYARGGATFFHNSEKEAFASIIKDGHRENYEVASPRFKLWVRHEFWRREKERMEAKALEREGGLYEGEAGGVETDMPTVVRDRDLSDAVRQLESVAIFEGAEEEVYIRTAGHGGRVYVDMGDEAWRAIEVSPLSWRIVEGKDIPVRFVRPRGLKALPDPAPSGEGSLEKLEGLLNLGDGSAGRRNRALILAWLSHAYLPNGPYPVLTLTGPQGAAKSHALRILRSLVDPSVAPGSTKPRSEHDAYIDAAANWVIAYDNLPTVPPWLSNVLCDIATGGGFRTRQLFTDRDQEIFSDKRPIILAGIGNVATRPDLLDRAVIVNLPRIEPKERKKETIIQAALADAQPEILTALLDAVAVGLAKRDSVELEELPRMADFAIWGVATEDILGAEEGDFLAAYTESRSDASEAALESWPVTDTFIEFAFKFQTEDNAWSGTATALLAVLNEQAEDEDLKRAKEWPKSGNALSAQINALVPDLAEIGIHVADARNMNQRVKRVWTVPKAPEPGEAGA